MNNNKILNDFNREYQHLKDKGMRIIGISGYETHSINVSLPFIFDIRQLPIESHGCLIRTTCYEKLPKEFCPEIVDDYEKYTEWSRNNYIWAPERYEKFVDRCADEIREKLGNPNMSRDEMLDALLRDFRKHKSIINERVRQGKIPPYKEGCE